MDAEDGNNDAEDEIECNKELVEHARPASEEAIHQSRECDGERIHARGRSDEDPPLEIRVGVFPVFETRFRPRVGKSTRRTRPMRMKTVAPRGATQLLQKVKKPLARTRR